MPLLLTLAWLALMGQENSAPNSAEVQIPSCGSCWGTRTRHTLGTIMFCVSHGIKLHRDSGCEGDIRDVMTISHRGKTGELIIYSSMNPSGNREVQRDWFPSGAPPHSTVRTWRCSEGSGRDLRLDRDGRYWRLITFPFGYAEWQCSTKYCDQTRQSSRFALLPSAWPVSTLMAERGYWGSWESSGMFLAAGDSGIDLMYA